jgi:hypothetical protein
VACQPLQSALVSALKSPIRISRSSFEIVVADADIARDIKTAEIHRGIAADLAGQRHHGLVEAVGFFDLARGAHKLNAHGVERTHRAIQADGEADALTPISLEPSAEPERSA